MNHIASLYNLDKEAFAEWEHAERRRLAGSTPGFARFIALLRMTQPMQVIWLSDGEEPATCGYDSNSVSKLVTEVLPVGAQMTWVKLANLDRQSTEITQYAALGTEPVGTPLMIICAPEGYDVSVWTGTTFSKGAAVVRNNNDWEFFTVQVQIVSQPSTEEATSVEEPVKEEPPLSASEEADTTTQETRRETRRKRTR